MQILQILGPCKCNISSISKLCHLKNFDHQSALFSHQSVHSHMLPDG